MEVKGIDVSHHQGTIDWKKVKAAGVEFAMLRACYGWDNDKQIDGQLQANVKGCEAAGVPYGLYHYSYAMTAEDGAKEAAFFLRVIRGMKPLYPVAFDFEEAGQLKLPLPEQKAIIDAFISTVKAAGYYVILYMSASPMERLLQAYPDWFSKMDCWVAHVGASKPKFSGKYGIWQYSWEGKIEGINGPVDMNTAYQDYPAVIKSAGLNGWAPAPGGTQGDSTTAPVDFKAKYLETLELLKQEKAKYQLLADGIKALAAKS